MNIGITEQGDAALDLSWMKYNGYKILITKDPDKLLKNCYPDDFKKAIIHCTITGMGGTVYEPNVPEPHVSYLAYTKLVEMLGVERVVLRVDPIFPEKYYWTTYHKPIIEGCISRLRVSFLDLYDHIRDNLKDLYINDSHKYKHADLDTRLYYLHEIEKIYNDVEVCGEPGIKCCGCISERDFKALKIPLNKMKGRTSQQRMECKCCGNKFELLTNKEPCPHGCLYCYWHN